MDSSSVEGKSAPSYIHDHKSPISELVDISEIRVNGVVVLKKGIIVSRAKQHPDTPRRQHDLPERARATATGALLASD
jgi:hypothetical protein